MDTGLSTTTSSDTSRLSQRIAENFLHIWADANIDLSTEDWQNTLEQVQSTANDVNSFTQPDEFIDFLTDVDDIKAFLILGDTLSSQIVPLIHDIPQLGGIYIFCNNKSHHEQWTKEWAKIKGVHTEVKHIFEALQLIIKQFNQDSIAISFLPKIEETSSDHLNQLEPSYMYTQIFKEILLQIEYDRKSFKDFILFWRQHCIDNPVTLKIITEFEHDYCIQSCIKWYTRERFVYQMLNCALRKLEAGKIIHMGFLIRDLHQQLEELHDNQVSRYHGQPFIVYRGQGLSTTDFEKLVQSKDGLIAFNNFLSTSRSSAAPYDLAVSALEASDKIGILFEMTIDPSVSSAPFASIGELSHFPQEQEVLFSMHTVFRIVEITKIDDNKSLYQVDLTLTADDDPELRTLTKCMRDEVASETGWQRLGRLLMRISQFDKAEELYNVLLEQTSDEGEKALYYNQLGYIKDGQGNYERAIEYHEKAFEIIQKTLPPNHSLLATYYSNIGMTYKNVGDYSKALSLCEKAHEIFEQIVSPNHSSLATSYNNIAGLYYNMGQYQKALSFYVKTCEIKQKTFPANHPSLVNSYNNIASVYSKMGEYSKALSLYEKTCEIFVKTLPSNHPMLARSYNNIAGVYDNIGDYSEALSYYEKALQIQQKSLPPEHPSLGDSYNNIGQVHRKMGEYAKALSFYEKTCEIFRKTLPPNHPSWAACYNNIAGVYRKMKEYPRALSYYEQALEIEQKSLPRNHHSLGDSYNNIGLLYKNMGEYSTALSFYEKALEMYEKTLPSSHPSLASVYNNIGTLYSKMAERSKALSYLERAQNIWQSSLPSNHPNIKIVQRNIEDIM